MAESNHFVLESWLGRTLMDGVEEVIGRTGVYAITNLALSNQTYDQVDSEDLQNRPSHRDLTRIQQALEKMYGFRGGCGILLRAGRASFKHLLHQYGVPMGIMDIKFRLLPAPRRIKEGLDGLARQFSLLAEINITVEDLENKWIWQMDICPFAWGRESSENLCSYTVGLLQEFLLWTGGGRIYSVWEVECQAAGAARCTIQIDKTPLD